MTMDRSERVEHAMPRLLEELAAAQVPAYLEAAIERASTRRQRPAWTFPERWLPMDLTARAPWAPAVPWRPALMLVLLLLLVAAAVISYIGSQRRSPAPFGVAGNGLVAFVDGAGQIVLADPLTGQTTVGVPGPGHDRPVFSPDGARLVHVSGDGFRSDLVVTDHRGGDPVTITPNPLSAPIGYLGWTPDGRTVAVTSGMLLLLFDATRQGPARVVGPVDGAPITVRRGDNASGDGYDVHIQTMFRPPAGDEILFLSPSGRSDGVFAIRPDGSGLRTLLDHDRPGFTYLDVASPQWSPDGSKIVLTIRQHDPETSYFLWLMDADGSDLRPLTQGAELRSENSAAWSPDGTKIAFQRWVNHPDGSVDVHPVTVIDIATGKETTIGDVSPNGFRGWAWSPDGQSIIQIPDAAEHVVIAPISGGPPRRFAAWATPGGMSWQRTAP